MFFESLKVTIRFVSIFLFFILISLGSFCVRAGQRVAIVGITEDENTAADFLSSALSDIQGLELLERGAILKVVSEMRLSSGALSSDYRRLGKLLGADGLILIKAHGSGKERWLSFRLADVDNGVIWVAARNPLPLLKPEEMATRVAKRFSPFLNKLFTAKKPPIKISLQSIRCPINHPVVKQVARNLNCLLAFRLMREPNFVVLERWRTRDLVFESNLKGRESKILTGTHVIEGTFELPDLSKPEEIGEIRISLKKADRSQVELKIDPGNDSLDTVVERIAEKVLNALQTKTAAPVNWNRKKEANSYRDEGKWAFSAGLYPEACSALETARTLGDKSKETLHLLLLNYAYLAFHDKRQFSSFFADRTGAVQNLSRAQIQQSLNAAINALETYGQYADDGRPKIKAYLYYTGWNSFGVKMLQNVSQFLVYVYKNRYDGDKDKLAYLRSLARELSKRLIKNYIPRKRERNPYLLKGAYQAYWQDSLEDGMKALKEFYNAENFYAVPDSDPANSPSQWTTLNVFNKHLYLVDWSYQSSQRELEEHLLGFAEKMMESKDFKQALIGWMMKSKLLMRRLKNRPKDRKLKQNQLNEKIEFDESLCVFLWSVRERLFFGDQAKIFADPLGGIPWLIRSKDKKRELGRKFINYIYQRKADWKSLSFKSMVAVAIFWLNKECDDSTTRAELADLAASCRKHYKNRKKTRLVQIFLKHFDFKSDSPVPKSDRAPFVIKRFWRPSDGKKKRAVQGFKLQQICALEDSFWVLGRSVTWRFRYKAQQFVFKNGAPVLVKEVLLPKSFNIYLENRRYTKMFAASSSYLAFLDRDKSLFIYDLNKNKWLKHKVPTEHCSSLLLRENQLYLGFSMSTLEDANSGLLKVTLPKCRTKLLASSIRRPPETPLDAIRNYTCWNLLDMDKNGLLIYAYMPFNGRGNNSIMCFFQCRDWKSDWKKLPAKPFSQRVCCRSDDQNVFILGYWNALLFNPYTNKSTFLLKKEQAKRETIISSPLQIFKWQDKHCVFTLRKINKCLYYEMMILSASKPPEFIPVEFKIPKEIAKKSTKTKNSNSDIILKKLGTWQGVSWPPDKNQLGNAMRVADNVLIYNLKAPGVWYFSLAELKKYLKAGAK